MYLINIINTLAQFSTNPLLYKTSLFILDFTGVILLFAVFFKFFEHAKKLVTVKEKKNHFFSTFGMTFLVLIFFKFWVCSIGQLNIQDKITQYIYFITGCVLIILGIIWHLKSKIDIGLFWSDGIEIKENHSIVQKGAYSIARHPMYASLLMWVIGASFLTFNWATFLMILFIFFPLMKIRASAEEKELIKENPEYIIYQENVKMLCPTLKGAYAIIIRVLVLLTFIYFVVKGVNLSNLMFLFGMHFYLGFSLTPEKVAFSYKTKSVMMIIVWLLSKFFPPIYYFYYVIMLMFIYGLKWNCPCMIMYEKYGGCPCMKMFKITKNK